MANAKKCDICGKLYENYSDSDNEDMIIFGHKNEPHIGGSVTKRLFDCCPDCLKSVKEHIESLKHKEA
jgi:hypothetical protein